MTDEPLHYPDRARRAWNNGFRLRALSLGPHRVRRHWDYSGRCRICVEVFWTTETSPPGWFPMWSVRDSKNDNPKVAK